jgi:predicted nucleic acid-binding protein
MSAALEDALEVARLSRLQQLVEIRRRQASTGEGEATAIAGRHQAQVQAGIHAQARRLAAQAAAQGAAHLAACAQQNEFDRTREYIHRDREI